MKSVNSFKMTGIGGRRYVDVTGDAPTAMNGVVVVGLIAIFKGESSYNHLTLSA